MGHARGLDVLDRSLAGRVPLHVLLARQLPQLEHHLVGEAAQHQRVAGEAVTLHPHRTADADRDRHEQARHHLADGLCLPRSDHRHRQHRRTAVERETGHARMALVETAVG